MRSFGNRGEQRWQRLRMADREARQWAIKDAARRVRTGSAWLRRKETPMGDVVPFRREGRVRVTVGKCPICGKVEESADDQLEHHRCCCSHAPARYVIVGGYYQDEAESWSDDG